jgi:hypothetical protein
VVLVGRWSMFLNGWHKNGKLQEQHHLLTTEATDTPSKESSLQALRIGLQDTVTAFGDAKLYVLQQVPDLNSTNSDERYFGNRLQREVIQAWHEPETKMFRNFEAMGAIEYIETHDLFCDDQFCSPVVDGINVYLDDNHLNDAGIAIIWSRIFRSIGSGN